MNCTQCHNYLMRHFDRNLDNKEWDLLNRHLHSCKSCFGLFSHLEEILGALETACPPELPSGLEELTLQRIKSLSAFRPNSQSGYSKLAYGSILTVVLSLALVVGLSLNNAGFSGLILQGRHLAYLFSGVVIDLQIVYRFGSTFFQTALLSIYHQIEMAYVAVILAAVFLALKTVFAKLGNDGETDPV